MKILIIKLAATGDVLRTTSILLPLKKKYPSARIFWVISKGAKDILLNNPYIETCYSLEEFTNLEKTHYDLVLSLDEDKRAAQLTSNIGGNIVGFYFKKDKVLPTKTARGWFNMSALGKKPMNNILKKKNKKTYQQHMLDIIGLPSKGTPRLEYPLIYELTNKEKKITTEFKKKYNISAKDVVIGFNTGAGKRWQYKKWSLAKTCELILKTSKLAGVKLLLFGGPEEKNRNKKIIQKVRNKIIDMGINNPLRVFAALLNICDILLTSDSLALHIGVALKKHVIVFFGPTSPSEIELYNNGKKIFPDLDCIVCYRQKCNLKHTCMDAISVDMMFQALYKSIMNFQKETESRIK